MTAPDIPDPVPEAPDTTVPPPSCGLTRRRFIAGLGATVGVVAAGAYGISIWARRDDTPAAVPGSTTTTTATTTTTSLPPGVLGDGNSGRTLVVIEMGGGNDSLNMVVPHQSPAYHDLRGDLAITTPLDLDGEIGLHPALEFVADRYQRNQLAIVEGIGYPDPDLSHFASMAVWWTGGAAAGANGWLGRYLDGVVGGEDPLAGITIGPGPSAAMLGDEAFVVSIQDLTGLAPLHAPWIDTTDELLASWAGFAPGTMDSPDLLGQVRSAIRGTVSATGALAAALGGESEQGQPTGGRRGRGSITDFLDVAARLLTSGLSPRVIYVHGFGDFDTHEGQAARQAALLEDLDAGLAAFFTAVEGAGLGDHVAVATTSEFGRRVAYNGSGTDHGTAAAHFVIGGGISGGRLGSPPDLRALDARGNMIHTVDFRSYYATLLSDWLGVAAAPVLGGEYEPLPLKPRT